jgi:hypothetical protein
MGRKEERQVAERKKQREKVTQRKKERKKDHGSDINVKSLVNTERDM